MTATAPTGRLATRYHRVCDDFRQSAADPTGQLSNLSASPRELFAAAQIRLIRTKARSTGLGSPTVASISESPVAVAKKVPEPFGGDDQKPLIGERKTVAAFARHANGVPAQ